VDRARIAGERNALYEQAVAACGPGALAYGMSVVRDRAGLEPTVRLFCCRRPEFTGWQPAVTFDVRAPENQMPAGPWKSPQDAFGFLVAKDFNGLKAGQWYRVCRWDVGLGSIEEYHPQTRDELDRAREAREAKKVGREMEDRPLLAAQIREDAYGSRPSPDEVPIRTRGNHEQ
jgi:hypothetical protein